MTHQRAAQVPAPSNHVASRNLTETNNAVLAGVGFNMAKL